LKLLTAILVCGSVLLGVQHCFAQAQKPVTSSAPPEFAYHLQRFALAGSKPTTYLWTLTRPPNEAVSIDGVAFQSLASPTLRQWVTEWQHNSTVPIIYITNKNLDANLTPTEVQATQREVDDFAQFCRSQGEAFFESTSKGLSLSR